MLLPPVQDHDKRSILDELPPLAFKSHNIHFVPTVGIFECDTDSNPNYDSIWFKFYRIYVYVRYELCGLYNLIEMIKHNASRICNKTAVMLLIDSCGAIKPFLMLLL